MNASFDDNTAWQRRLLPFMTRSIAVMGLLFFLGSSLQIYLIHHELRADPIAPASPRAGADARWQALIALERDALARESRVVNAVVMRQSSLLHLGFMTGMVLCLVGSVFVLGRLDIAPTRIDGEAQAGKFGLSTSSPGIVLACLGCGLMCATLFHRFQFNLPEKTVYVLPGADADAPRSPTPAPPAPADGDTGPPPRGTGTEP